MTNLCFLQTPTGVTEELVLSIQRLGGAAGTPTVKPLSYLTNGCRVARVNQQAVSGGQDLIDTMGGPGPSTLKQLWTCWQWLYTQQYCGAYQH